MENAWKTRGNYRKFQFISLTNAPGDPAADILLFLSTANNTKYALIYGKSKPKRAAAPNETFRR